MDPITLAGTVISIIGPYIMKGADAFVNEVGQSACDAAQSLLDRIKKKFGDDDEATGAIENYEAKPQRYEPVVEDILQTKLGEDEAFANDIASIVENMGPVLSIVQKMDVGQNVTGLSAKEMRSGQATVQQEIKQGTNIVGASFEKLG